MEYDEIAEEYFSWLCELVSGEEYDISKYGKLMRKLHETDFTYGIAMDGNRAEDGINLRYRFGRAKGYDERITAIELDYRPCSVLEMMVALAVRCEEQIMIDLDVGLNAGRWFWIMVENLGLETVTNAKYDDGFVLFVVERFLNRNYYKNGEGGLFKVTNPNSDMREIEIWYQMCCYLNELLDNEEY